MCVSPNLRIAHIVRDTQGLISKVPRGHASEAALGTEPVDIVVDNEQTSGSNQGRDGVVIEGQYRHLIDVVVEAGREPGVFADNF